MLITDKYIKLNEQLHADRPGYGAGGGRWTNYVTQLCETNMTDDVLDYGCGKGVLAATIGWEINQYDPATRPGTPVPADVVACTDVLEHIEPENLDDVLSHIASLTKKVAFLNISTRKANKKLKDGRNAHLIVKPAEWWAKQLSKYFRVEVISSKNHEFNVLAYPV